MNAVLVEMETIPLFDSAYAAVRFAVTRSGAPARPVMNRMTDASIAETGLGGLDGAAQAGIIMSVVHLLGAIPEAALVASCAPHSISCACRRPCCSGRVFNATWNAALNSLCDGIVIFTLKPGGTLVVAERGAQTSHLLRMEAESTTVEIDRGIRLGALMKIYGLNLTLVKIANSTGKHAETVSKYHQAIHRWLKGAPASRHAEAVEGVETMAWRDAESALRQRGIVG